MFSQMNNLVFLFLNDGYFSQIANHSLRCARHEEPKQAKPREPRCDCGAGVHSRRRVVDAQLVARHQQTRRRLRRGVVCVWGRRWARCVRCRRLVYPAGFVDGHDGLAQSAVHVVVEIHRVRKCRAVVRGRQRVLVDVFGHVDNAVGAQEDPAAKQHIAEQTRSRLLLAGRSRVRRKRRSVNDLPYGAQRRVRCGIW